MYNYYNRIVGGVEGSLSYQEGEWVEVGNINNRSNLVGALVDIISSSNTVGAEVDNINNSRCRTFGSLCSTEVVVVEVYQLLHKDHQVFIPLLPQEEDNNVVEHVVEDKLVLIEGTVIISEEGSRVDIKGVFRALNKVVKVYQGSAGEGVRRL